VEFHVTGSEGGGEETISRKADTAPRRRPNLSTVRRTQRNVTRWRGGDMRMRWTAAGLAEAQKSFRRVKGHRDMPKLTAAIRRELDPTPTEEAAAQAA
jgi:putative transposase